MQLRALETIAREMHADGVRYLIVGGMAVVAHGYGRMTFDIDMVIKLDAKNIMRAFTALGRAGYVPRLPVTPEQFADVGLRDEWIKTKGMVVFNMWSDTFKDTPVDLFVTEPFDFDQVEAAALEEELDDGTPLRFVSIPALIAMKKVAGREKDMDDIRQLEILNNEC